MVVALIISLILNLLSIGAMLWINESWYRDEIKLIKDFDKKYSRLNDEWAEFCKKQVEEAVNETADAIQKAIEGTGE